MVLYYLKKNIPPHLFWMIHPLEFWKYSEAKPNEVIEFYFLKDGTLDGIQVERLQLIKF